MKTLIEILTIEIQNDLENNQGKLINIEQEILIKMKVCFQEMVCSIFLNNHRIIISDFQIVSFDPSIQTLWTDLYSFLTQRFNQMVSIYLYR